MSAITLSPWSIELYLYKLMATNADNPSGVSGNNTDPVDAILQLLQSGNPDWNKISSELDKIQGDIQNIINVAKENKLDPPSVPGGFLNFLNKIETTIANLKNAIGNPTEFSSLFKNGLCAQMGDLRQFILQG